MLPAVSVPLEASMLLAASVPSSGTPLLAERSEGAEAAPVLVLEFRTVAGRK